MTASKVPGAQSNIIMLYIVKFCIDTSMYFPRINIESNLNLLGHTMYPHTQCAIS